MTEYLTGKFTVKEGASGESFIAFEAGPGPLVCLMLSADAQATGEQLVKLLNAAVTAVRVEGT